ncbi:class I adenylate-forming enzyme family protein [Alkalihalobacterium alkalinitrilicum]|uniref:class I adenylate-forming enzyme family protein n=1 Tax=Alkalihalobacterium alkalinitrilicum TaxID=427920 RepID=UPI000994B114|nr:AMP-binding protein [Alkalihalobacterium alkalinitrilicum]
MNFGSLHTALATHAKNKPNDIAIVYYDQSYTFKEVFERVNALANSLIECGISKGDHVSLYMRNRSEMVEILYALSTIGAVAVPINYMVEGKDLAQLINTSDSKFIFVEEQQLPAYENVLSMLSMIDHRSTFLVGSNQNRTYLLYDQLMNLGSTQPPLVEVVSDDINAMLYSSGTTSLPKGIILTHGNLMYRAFACVLDWGLTRNDTILISVPMYHSVGHLYTFMANMAGCKAVITRDFRSDETLKTIQNHQITHAFFVPTQYRLMLNTPSFETYDFSSLKTLVSAAAPLSATTKTEIIEKFKCNLTEFFGSTESGISTSLLPEDVIRKTASVGQQYPFIDVRLVDEQGHDVDVDEEGEFAVRGPGVFQGYYKRSEAMEENLLPGGWFRIGDMGKMDNEGFYFLLDRKKDMIISGGVNVYPKDIEEVIYTHPVVLEAAVIGVPHEKWGEQVKAYVVLKEGENIEVESLLSFCNEKLAKFQRIKDVEFVSALPRNPSGKILKRELRKQIR